jgi:hypothetical protein
MLPLTAKSKYLRNPFEARHPYMSHCEFSKYPAPSPTQPRHQSQQRPKRTPCALACQSLLILFYPAPATNPFTPPLHPAPQARLRCVKCASAGQPSPLGKRLRPCIAHSQHLVNVRVLPRSCPIKPRLGQHPVPMFGKLNHIPSTPTSTNTERPPSLFYPRPCGHCVAARIQIRVRRLAPRTLPKCARGD